MSNEMNFSHSYKETRKYRKYHQDHQLVDEVLCFFNEHNEKEYSLIELGKKTNIDPKVLSKWRIALKKDPSYRPGGKFGYHRRRFTQVQEIAIADLLRIQYVLPGIIIRRKHLRELFFDLWKSFDLEARGKVAKKFFSNTFVHNFCKRNDFSFRQMRKKKRSVVDAEEVEKYGREFVEAFTSVPWNRILNMDETAWNFVFVRGKVLSIKGKEEVDAQLPDDYRKSFTAIATISADGSKLPPLFLAKGSTKNCEKQFDGMKSDPNDYFLFHSQGGNTDNDAMIFLFTPCK